jgi:hypothetical protein
MRFREIRGGIQIPVSNEEQGLIDLIESQEGNFIKRSELDERQREVARKMVSRGVLERTQRDGSLYYVVSKLDDLWR